MKRSCPIASELFESTPTVSEVVTPPAPTVASVETVERDCVYSVVGTAWPSEDGVRIAPYGQYTEFVISGSALAIELKDFFQDGQQYRVLFYRLPKSEQQ